MQASGEPSPFNDLLLDIKLECCKCIDRVLEDLKTLAALSRVSKAWKHAVDVYLASRKWAICHSPEALPQLCEKLTGVETLTLYKGEMRVWNLAALKQCTTLTKLDIDSDALRPDSAAASELFPLLDLAELPTTLQTLGLQTINIRQSSLNAFSPAALKMLTWQTMKSPPSVLQRLLQQLPDLRVRLSSLYMMQRELHTCVPAVLGLMKYINLLDV